LYDSYFKYDIGKAYGVKELRWLSSGIWVVQCVNIKVYLNIAKYVTAL
jgi:hypothetical protein